MNSIRRVLLISLIGVTSLVLLVAAGFSYRAGLQEAGELFDAKLAHSSRVLMSLVDEPLELSPAPVHDARPLADPMESMNLPEVERDMVGFLGRFIVNRNVYENR